MARLPLKWCDINVVTSVKTSVFQINVPPPNFSLKLFDQLVNLTYVKTILCHCVCSVHKI